MCVCAFCNISSDEEKFFLYIYIYIYIYILLYSQYACIRAAINMYLMHLFLLDAFNNVFGCLARNRHTYICICIGMYVGTCVYMHVCLCAARFHVST